MNKIYILCDGGFGNRLGALIPGLILADKFNREPVISWPITNWCECPFDDIYESFCESNTKNCYDLFSENLNAHFLIHENQTDDFGDKPKLLLEKEYQVHSENLGNIIDGLTNIPIEEDIVFFNHLIPSYFSEDIIVKYLKKLKLKQNILDKVVTFCDTNSIDSNVSGAHLRKTDFPTSMMLDDTQLFNHLNTDVDSRFFVCSDDLDTEKKFSKFPNVSIYEKNSSVITNNNNRYDIIRPSESVIDGIIDMLILSRTTITNTNFGSTFLLFASRYSKIKLGELL
jgi:hypothetical protein